MKKSLIALAVASAVAAPAAFAATSNVDVYGVMNIAVRDTNAANVSHDIVDNASRIGFKGSEDLGGGLKALWQIEQQINATGNASTTDLDSADGTQGIGETAFGGANLRNTFVGLSGGFGTVVMGRHDHPYKMSTGKYNIFADTIGDYAGGATRVGPTAVTQHGNGNTGGRPTDAIAYIAPTMNGLSLAAAIVTVNGDGADKATDAWTVSAGYANGPLTVDAAYLNHQFTAGTAATELAKLGAGYSFGDTKVGLVYEDVNAPANADDRNSSHLALSHAMGPIVLKATYADIDNKTTADQTLWAVGADYNLSKRTSVYGVYANGKTNGASARTGFDIGVKHSF